MINKIIEFAIQMMIFSSSMYASCIIIGKTIDLISKYLWSKKK